MYTSWECMLNFIHFSSIRHWLYASECVQTRSRLIKHTIRFTLCILGCNAVSFDADVFDMAVFFYRFAHLLLLLWVSCVRTITFVQPSQCCSIRSNTRLGFAYVMQMFTLYHYVCALSAGFVFVFSLLFFFSSLFKRKTIINYRLIENNYDCCFPNKNGFHLSFAIYQWHLIVSDILN